MKNKLGIYTYNWDLLYANLPVEGKTQSVFYEIPPFTTNAPELPSQFRIRDEGMSDGHVTMADYTYYSFCGLERDLPIAPLFARDLAGRVIYLGYGPQRKGDEEWRAYGEVDAAKKVPRTTFPRHCRVVDESVEGADLIEEVFFTKFRPLDQSMTYYSALAGEPATMVPAYYRNANLYPYKLRLDTFYIDGWKLPQTEMLYAKEHSEGEAKGEEFLQKWQNRPQGQGYEEFHEANGGDEWFEGLFDQGCTVIPTFEGHNGFNKVNENFELEDFHPGRAVPGLHEVVETRPDAAPPDTILEVIEPGYITAHKVVPAKVVVSNGESYESPHEEDPAPLVPNLYLPHPRIINNWLATWLPTHPSHFEPPAIWGWDPTCGHFMQTYGPVWDPLHYYYTSVDKVVSSFKEPMAENPNLVRVPEEMKMKFHPVAPMPGFDTISQDALEMRDRKGIQPLCAISRIKRDIDACSIGYHPLPLAFEFELDNWWFPELDPRQRITQDIPEDLKERMMPVVVSDILPKEYLQTVVGPKDAAWLTDPELFLAPSGHPTGDYPELLRYLDPDLSPEEIFRMIPLYLADLPDEILQITAQQLWGDAEMMDMFESLTPGFYDAVYELREAGLKLRRFRHELFSKNKVFYALCWWYGVEPLESIKLLQQQRRIDPDQPTRQVEEAAVHEDEDIMASAADEGVEEMYLPKI